MLNVVPSKGRIDEKQLATLMKKRSLINDMKRRRINDVIEGRQYIYTCINVFMIYLVYSKKRKPEEWEMGMVKTNNHYCIATLSP